MTDETTKTPENTNTESQPSVLDEIAAEETRSLPDENEQTVPKEQQQQDTPAQTGTDEKEPQPATDAGESDSEDHYKTLQEKIADADKLLGELQTDNEETAATKDVAQPEEPGEDTDQKETAAREPSPETDSEPAAASDEPGQDNAPAPDTAQEKELDDSKLKTKVFGILDKTQAGAEHAASEETAPTETQPRETPREPEEPNESSQETPTPTPTEESSETAAPEAPPETPVDSTVELQTTPKPASGSPVLASGAEPLSVETPEAESPSPNQTSLVEKLKTLSRPGELLTRFERSLDESENIRTAWVVFGCISLGTACLALLMWLLSSM